MGGKAKNYSYGAAGRNQSCAYCSKAADYIVRISCTNGSCHWGTGQVAICADCQTAKLTESHQGVRF